MDKLAIAKKSVAVLRTVASYKALVKRGMLSQEDCDVLISDANRVLSEMKSQLGLPLQEVKASAKK